MCSEGEVTEPGYFEYVRSRLRDALITIRIESRSDPDPLAVVRIAVEERDRAAALASRERDENAAYDHVWAVIDVDEHARLPQAIALAREEGIALAISNPCFELWPLLHFTDQRAYIERQALRSKLQQHMPGYDKRLDCSKLTGRYSEARSRANALASQHQRNAGTGSNPSTRVHVLVEAILDSARRSAADPNSFRPWL